MCSSMDMALVWCCTLWRVVFVNAVVDKHDERSKRRKLGLGERPLISSLTSTTHHHHHRPPPPSSRCFTRLANAGVSDSGSLGALILPCVWLVDGRSFSFAFAKQRQHAFLPPIHLSSCLTPPPPHNHTPPPPQPQAPITQGQDKAAVLTMSESDAPLASEPPVAPSEPAEDPSEVVRFLTHLSPTYAEPAKVCRSGEREWRVAWRRSENWEGRDFRVAGRFLWAGC